MNDKTQDERIVRMGAWSAGPGCHGGCGVKLHLKNGKLLKVEGDDRLVRISNVSSFPLEKCRFAEGMSTTHVGVLAPGASVSAERLTDVVGPMFSCVADASPLEYIEAQRSVVMNGSTQVVVYRNRDRTIAPGADQ